MALSFAADATTPLIWGFDERPTLRRLALPSSGAPRYFVLKLIRLLVSFSVTEVALTTTP